MENGFSNLYKTTTNIQNCSRFPDNFSMKYGISKHFPYFVEILPPKMNCCKRPLSRHSETEGQRLMTLSFSKIPSQRK